MAFLGVFHHATPSLKKYGIPTGPYQRTFNI